jgi:predicted phage tail protein
VSARDRIDLFHTSIQPNRAGKAADSRVNDWVHSNFKAQERQKNELKSHMQSVAYETSQIEGSPMAKSEVMHSKPDTKWAPSEIIHVPPVTSGKSNAVIKETES